MKSIITIAFLSLMITVSAQYNEVKFKELSFANGMNYPQVVMPGNKTHEDTINLDIQKRLADLEKSDFCIGQYGYVQKSTHLQIHVFCTCIDFEESVNRYFFYNIETGKPVNYTDIINPKVMKEASNFLAQKANAYLKSNGKEASNGSIENVNEFALDAFEVILTKDGVDLWLKNEPNWGEKAMSLTWIELKSYMKLQFI